MAKVSFTTKDGKRVSFTPRSKGRKTPRRTKRNNPMAKRRTPRRRYSVSPRRRSQTKRGLRLSIPILLAAAVGYMGYLRGYAGLIPLVAGVGLVAKVPKLTTYGVAFMAGQAARTFLGGRGIGLPTVGNGATPINGFLE